MDYCIAKRSADQGLRFIVDFVALYSTIGYHRRFERRTEMLLSNKNALIYYASNGKPDAFHSGSPSSSRRTLKPSDRRVATASKERTQ
jgi:hypothetical protein